MTQKTYRVMPAPTYHVTIKVAYRIPVHVYEPKRIVQPSVWNAWFSSYLINSIHLAGLIENPGPMMLNAVGTYV